MRIVAFMNQKGGVGKTTTAVSIGSILAHDYGRRILLIDLDPQGNLTDHLGIDPDTIETSIYDVLIEGENPSQVLRSVHGLDVLPANIDLSGAELELASMMMREVRLKNALLPLCEQYDEILIDCPPSLGLLTVSGLTLAHEVIVPMEAEYLALRGLSQLVRTVDLVRQHLNPNLVVSGVVFCMFDGRTLLARSVRDEVEAFFPGKVYETTIRKNIRLAEAPSHGMPIDLYDSACAGTEDYRALTREFLTRAGITPSPIQGAKTERAPEPKSPPSLPSSRKSEWSLPSQRSDKEKGEEIEEKSRATASAVPCSVEEGSPRPLPSVADHRLDPSLRIPLWKGDSLSQPPLSSGTEPV